MNEWNENERESGKGVRENFYKCASENAGKCGSQAYKGMSEEPFVRGVVRFNLIECIWFASCSIVTDHHSFLYVKAMFFSYLHAAGGKIKVFRRLENTMLRLYFIREPF